MRTIAVLCLAIGGFLAACNDAPPAAAGNGTDAAPAAAQLTNPASVNCARLGGRSRRERGPDGEFSICVLPDNRECEEWALLRGECPAATVAGNPLPSWNDTAATRAILAFVARVTTAGGPDFVAPAERIAVFDNDGTLWSEQPIYFQLAFALDRVRALAPQHPEWREREPFKSVLAGDVAAALASGEHGVLELMAATHVGNTTEEFEQIVRDWIATARHPRFDRPYTELVYQPMLELLGYLRANGFKTFIVSGGGADFMRPWAEATYGIPPDQVVGSRPKLEYEVRDGVPRIERLAEIDLIDDKAGKPVGIQQVIGRRPIAAFGNSDGDFEMLEWTTSGSGPRFGAFVRHTDADREWAYDRGSPIGKLERGLDEAAARGWTVIDMKQDWNAVYAFDR